jgi:hypothetical protein
MFFNLKILVRTRILLIPESRGYSGSHGIRVGVVGKIIPMSGYKAAFPCKTMCYGWLGRTARTSLFTTRKEDISVPEETPVFAQSTP